MHRLLFIIVALFVFVADAIPQTLEELKKIEEIKKQLENVSDSNAKKKPQVTEPISLTTFQEKLSTYPGGTKSETDNTETVPKSKNEFDDLSYFGYEIFNNPNLDFKPEIYGPVDEAYLVNVGDELVISIWGEVELRYELTLDRNGQIFIPEVGLVNAVGMRLAQIREKLIKRMGNSYSSLLKKDAHLEVSLGKIRPIRLYIVGDVGKPGVYTVPPFTSPFNLLFYAAGVKNAGSLRNIQLVRNDQLIETLDFYEFLVKGMKFTSTRLQNFDVLLIPPKGKEVYLAGAVQKPCIYELKENEQLSHLLDLAGGFSHKAYLEQIRIERYSNNTEYKEIDINYREFRNNSKDFNLEDGDRIVVYSLDRTMRNFIFVEGAILGPKKFQYTDNMSLLHLYNQIDSIRGDAYLDRIEITRTLENRDKQIFSANLSAILLSEQRDILLKPEDHIIIKSRLNLFPVDSVKIYGAVNNPGKYLNKENMTLKDIIFAAGGFRKNALITEAEISRIDFSQTGNDTLATIIFVPIDSNYTKSEHAADEKFLLQNFDNIFIRTNSDWELQRNVTIRGEVNNPGIYTLKSKTERITDIIQRTRGLKQTAYLKGATFERSQDGVGQIGIDFEAIMSDPNSEENIILQSGDIIRIPEILHTVKVIGGVNFPSSVLFEEGRNAEYYINSAGGFIDLADDDNISVRLANGRMFKEKNFLFYNYWPYDITAGSTIYIPVLSERDEIDWSGTVRDAAAILSSIATVILIYDRVR